MSDLVKIKLKNGAREIEVEGTSSIVDTYLNKWWNHNSDSESEGTEPSREGPKRLNNSKQTRKKAASPSEAEPSFDVQALINIMREDEKFPIYETKILHENDLANKIKLISWFAKTDLTSGDIGRVLTGLGVKNDQPTISRKLKSDGRDFLQDRVRRKGAIIRYKLSSLAEKSFREWLDKNCA